MHTGITIEKLIATVARVDAKIESQQKMDGNTPMSVKPFLETVNLLACPGVM